MKALSHWLSYLIIIIDNNVTNKVELERKLDIQKYETKHCTISVLSMSLNYFKRSHQQESRKIHTELRGSDAW